MTSNNSPITGLPQTLFNVHNMKLENYFYTDQDPIIHYHQSDDDKLYVVDIPASGVSVWISQKT